MIKLTRPDSNGALSTEDEGIDDYPIGILIGVYSLDHALVEKYFNRQDEIEGSNANWENLHGDNFDEIHVIPRNDLLPHDSTDECGCLPQTEPVPRDDGSMGWLITHNAWNGRE